VSGLQFRVRGIPAPQGSKRGFPVRRTHGKLGVALVESAGEKVTTWRQDVRVAAMEAHDGAPLPGPLAVTIMFYVARPKSHFRTGRNAHLLRESAPACPAGKPDLDKLVRSTLDALTSAGVYADDSQVVHLTTGKHYSTGCITPGAQITVETA
jgi:Holliday junction resolvase RusA-like endonuclease